MTYSSLRLKKNEDRRLQNGHLWIYSNEIDVAQSPLKSFTPGQLVCIENHLGKPLGVGYINPQTLLSVRLLTRDIKQPIDQALFEQRLQTALTLRDKLFAEPYYRLVYGESDGLPGLIVDRYGPHLCVQITTAGMEALKSEIIAALERVVKPQSILLRNDHSMRVMEGLSSGVEAVLGTVPERIELIENGVTFQIDPWTGQKTGWFYDHRENRAQLHRYVKNKRVLDLFSYVGGWAIQAAVFGAKQVVAVDSSGKALELLQHNAIQNKVSECVQAVQNDAFEQLKLFNNSNEKFDVIILDPPAFIKKRKDLAAGLIAYRRINELALRLLSEEGFLISASCSHHLSREQLVQVVLESSLKSKRDLKIISHGHQGPDHPIHPAIPETDYLKAIVFASS